MAEFELSLIGRDQLKMVDTVHPIKIGERLEMNQGRYYFSPVTFLDEMKESADAGLFHLPPHTQSRSVLISGGNVNIVDTAIKGHIWTLTQKLLAGGQENGIGIHYLDVRPNKQLLRYGSGTFITYFSGDEEATLLGVCWPPFTDEMEVAADEFGQKVVGGVDIASSYWYWYQQLLTFK